MNKTFRHIVITTAILILCFFLCLAVQYIFMESSLIPALFVLGVFLISDITEDFNDCLSKIYNLKTSSDTNTSA